MKHIAKALCVLFFVSGCGGSSQGPKSEQKPATVEPQTSVPQKADRTDSQKAAAQWTAEISGKYEINSFGCNGELDAQDLPSFLRTMNQAVNAYQKTDSTAALAVLKQVEDQIKGRRAVARAQSQAADAQADTAKARMDNAGEVLAKAQARKEYFELQAKARTAKQSLQVIESESQSLFQLMDSLKSDPSNFIANRVKREISVTSGVAAEISIRFQFAECRLTETFTITKVSKKDALYSVELKGIAAEQTCQRLGFQGTHQNLVEDRTVELTYDSASKVWTDLDPARALYFCGQAQNLRSIQALSHIQ